MDRCLSNPVLEQFYAQALALGREYGVDPRVFAAIYVGAIPFFLAFSAWLVKNWRAGRSIVLPAALTALSFVASYLYVAIAGRNIPWWIWAVLAVVVLGGGWSAVRGLRRKVES